MTKSKRKPLYSHTDDVFVGKHMTKQSGAMTPAAHWRAFVSGQPLPDARPPVYADISDVDYGQARDLLAEFDSEFQALPAPVRDRFANDSDNYFDWLEDNQANINENGFREALSAFMEPSENIDSVPEAEQREAESSDSAQESATEPDAGT